MVKPECFYARFEEWNVLYRYDGTNIGLGKKFVSPKMVLVALVFNQEFCQSYQRSLKKIKTDEFLCSHFNIEDGDNKQHFWHIMLYFKKGKNAIEMQKICAVYGEGACD